MNEITKEILKRIFDRCGLYVRRRNAESDPDVRITKVIQHLQIDLILDVGANIGQFAGSVRRHGYRGRIVSFEPQKSAHAKLLAAARHDPLWTIAPPVAVGDCEGEAQLNISRNSVSSSLMPMEEIHIRRASESIYVGTERVPVVTLDQVALPDMDVAVAPYLKIDTQGFEKKVLAGAPLVLKKVAAVQLELSLVELYSGQPLFEEVAGYMKELGFRLFSILPGIADLESGRNLQVEGIFVPESRL